MTRLAEKRTIMDFKFQYKIVNCYINCPKLLSCLNFNVPHCRTRFSKTFYIPFQKTNYTFGSSINIILNLANDVQVDLYNFNSIEYFIIITTYYFLFDK